MKTVSKNDALTVKQIRQFEETAIKIGFSERLLIENASSSLCEKISQLKLEKNVLIVAGKGNNGADVLACGRKLLICGYQINVVIIKEGNLNNEVIFQKNILEKLNGSIKVITENNLDQFKIFLKNKGFILDGILGIGISGNVSLFIKNVIVMINNSKKMIVSCDVPSGLSPDNGLILGTAVKANYTVTFIAPKLGFFIKPGKTLCGKVLIANIGVSRKALEGVINYNFKE